MPLCFSLCGFSFGGGRFSGSWVDNWDVWEFQFYTRFAIKDRATVWESSGLVRLLRELAFRVGFRERSAVLDQFQQCVAVLGADAG